MRVVIDTNIIISALISSTSLSNFIIVLWRNNHFDVVSSSIQISEFRNVINRDKISSRTKKHARGFFVNLLKKKAIICKRNLDSFNISPDPNDNFLIAKAFFEEADFLITGDKNDLLSLAGSASFPDGWKTKIVSQKTFLESNPHLSQKWEDRKK